MCTYFWICHANFFFLNAVLLHSWKRKYGSGRGGATALCLTEVIILAAVWLFPGVVSPLAYKYGKNEFLSSPCSLFSHEQIVTGHIGLKLNRPWGGRNCLHFYAKMGYLLPHLVWWQHGVQRSLPYLFNRKCHHLFLISMVTGHLESLKKKIGAFSQVWKWVQTWPQMAYSSVALGSLSPQLSVSLAPSVPDDSLALTSVTMLPVLLLQLRSTSDTWTLSPLV